MAPFHSPPSCVPSLDTPPGKSSLGTVAGEWRAVGGIIPISLWEHKCFFNCCQRRLLGNVLLIAIEMKGGGKQYSSLCWLNRSPVMAAHPHTLPSPSDPRPLYSLPCSICQLGLLTYLLFFPHFPEAGPPPPPSPPGRSWVARPSCLRLCSLTSCPALPCCGWTPSPVPNVTL